MIIHIAHLSKTYVTYERGNSFREVLSSMIVRKTKPVQAVKNISFDVNEGELVGFLGPNGAGKSTTLKILTGVLYPTSGAVTVLGYTPWKDRKKYVAHIGAVFGQKSQLIWDIPPVDAFHMNKAIYALAEKDFSRTLAALVELLEVGPIIRTPTRLLSLGERMKCEFIMAMLHQPKIVFLDEPTIGMDVIAKDKIRGFILEMNRKGVTFVLTTHDLDDVEHLARRVIVINHGEMIFDNSLDALRNHLGTKKVVFLSTQRPLPELVQPGVMLTKPISAYEAEFELDVSVLELNRFIEWVNRTSVINDLSIQALPIESVIKGLYTQG
jgi:ABC-2 type transport system ATP-binding protein